MYLMMPYPGLMPPMGLPMGGPAYLVIPLPAGFNPALLFGGAQPGGAVTPGVTIPGAPGIPGVPGLPGFPGIPNLPGLAGSLVGAGIGAAGSVAGAAIGAGADVIGAGLGAAGSVAGAAAGAAGDVLNGASNILGLLEDAMTKGLDNARKDRDRLDNAVKKAGRAANKELKDAAAFAQSRVKALEEGAKNVADAAGHVLGSLFGKK